MCKPTMVVCQSGHIDHASGNGISALLLGIWYIWKGVVLLFIITISTTIAVTDIATTATLTTAATSKVYD